MNNSIDIEHFVNDYNGNLYTFLMNFNRSLQYEIINNSILSNAKLNLLFYEKRIYDFILYNDTNISILENLARFNITTPIFNKEGKYLSSSNIDSIDDIIKKWSEDFELSNYIRNFPLYYKPLEENLYNRFSYSNIQKPEDYINEAIAKIIEIKKLLLFKKYYNIKYAKNIISTFKILSRIDCIRLFIRFCNKNKMTSLSKTNNFNKLLFGSNIKEFYVYEPIAESINYILPENEFTFIDKFEANVYVLKYIEPESEEEIEGLTEYIEKEAEVIHLLMTEYKGL